MKIDNYVIMASLKSEPACKLINRIPGLRLLMSSLPGLQAFSKPCLVKLITKDNHLIFSCYMSQLLTFCIKSHFRCVYTAMKLDYKSNIFV